ncbi:MAG: DNA polymerase III subunit delta' [Candidatus Staskawiczbacteria bacterium]|nr:DNA polymerase III subunit delta' [Candidatus Staskawiczbacteria bacterium]
MIIGHQKQCNFLKKIFESNQLAHAYLFSGAEQLGKKVLAKEFVKLINCVSDQSNKKPCGVCKNCKDIEKESYLDLLFVKPADDKKEIEVSQIREVLNFLSYKSYYGSFKAVIIDKAETMNSEAQSCLLKTLEEPKGKTILILISEHPEMLFGTILSRCQAIKFYCVNQKEIENHLVKIGAKEKIAKYLSSFCQGRPGRAINLFLNPEELEKEQKSLEELVKVVNSGLAEKFQYAKKINTEKNNLNQIFQILQRYLRHLLFIKTGAEALAHQDYFPEASGNLKNYSVSKIKDVLKLLETINMQTSLTNANPKLAFEILLMEM